MTRRTGARASATASVASAAAAGSRVAARVAVPAPSPATTSRACLHAAPTRAMAALAALLAGAALLQVTLACKNCVVLGKAEKAMFRAHSDACMSQSQVDPKLVETLLSGDLTEDPALRRHVYCVLLKCKVVGKDGKLLKTAVLGKLALRSDGRNATKILEKCADQSTDLAPEDAAWYLFKCGYDRKAVIFEYMPADKQPTTEVA